MRKISYARATMLALACSLSITAYAQVGKLMPLDIPSGDLIASLRILTEQSGAEFVYREDQLSGLRTGGVRGSLTAEQALAKLLQGSGYSAKLDSSGVLIIVKAVSNAPNQSGAGEKAMDENRPEKKEKQAEDATADPVTLEQVNVLGTRLAQKFTHMPTLLSIERYQIEQRGIMSVADYFRYLPQNSGTYSDLTMGALNGGQSQVFGAGIDLRGLGGDATLVLLDGKRLARPGDGSMVDVSMIPLSMIEGVDVLTDGASAIYGADAVAGVVNLRLRRDFDGGEAKISRGQVAEGDLADTTLSIAQGFGWETGGMILAADQFSRKPLHYSDRDYLQLHGLYADMAAIPGQERESFLVAAYQDIPLGGLSANVRHLSRDASAYYSVFGAPIYIDSTVRELGGSLGWLASIGSYDLSVGYSWDVSKWKTVYTIDGVRDQVNLARSGVQSIDWQLRSQFDEARGYVFAIGGEAREEEYRSSEAYADRRTVMSLFGEYDQRLWERSGKRLAANASARFENYSDFGSSLSPKLALSWSDGDRYSVSYNIGRSFKVPLFSQQDPANSYYYRYKGGYFPGIEGEVLLLGGNSPDLDSQTATHQSLAVQWKPAKGARFNGSIYRIEYKGKIAAPVTGAFSADEIANSPAYQSIVRWDPQADDVASILDRLMLVNCIGGTLEETVYCNDEQLPDPGAVSLILDNRLMNVGWVRTTGVDLGMALNSEWLGWSWSIDANVTKTIDHDIRLNPTLPMESMIDNVYYPTSLSGVATVAASHKDDTFSVTAKYVDDYPDRRDLLNTGAGKRDTVGSWTTLDLAYGRSFYLGGTQARFGLAVQNVLDREPPFVANVFGLNYDSVNADVRGRFYSATVTVSW